MGKNLFVACCAAGMLVVLETGCSKKNTETPVLEQERCHVTYMHDTVHWRSGGFWNFRYDENDRLLECSGSAQRIAFTYQDRFMYSETSNSPAGDVYIHDTTLLRADGKPEWSRRTVIDGSVTTARFQYDASGQLEATYTTVEQFGRSETDTIYFTWESGNVIRETTPRGMYLRAYTYDMSRERQQADGFYWQFFQQKGFAPFTSRNLIKGLNGITYNYAFDEKGRIIADTIMGGGNVPEIQTYRYECR